MDFREFSKAYNDYLMHAGDREEWWKRTAKHQNKEGSYIAKYVTNPDWQRDVRRGMVGEATYNDCLSIANNKNYSDSQKTAMIMKKLQIWYDNYANL